MAKNSICHRAAPLGAWGHMESGSRTPVAGAVCQAWSLSCQPCLAPTGSVHGRLNTTLAAASGPGEHTHLWKLCSRDPLQPLETHCRTGKSLLRGVQDLSEQGLQRAAPAGWQPQQGWAEGHCHLQKFICLEITQHKKDGKLLRPPLHPPTTT